MKIESQVVVLKKERGFEGAHLYEDDISLLNYLMIHQTMRTRNIYDFVLSLGDRHEVGISNRLGKLCRAGVLRKHQTSYSTFYYRLGLRGIDVLLSQGFINETEVGYFKKFIVNKKSLSSHDEAVSTIANQTYIHCKKTGYFNGLNQNPGYSHKLFGDNKLLVFEERNVIVPDWVFSKGDTHICLEIDTGSQRGTRLTPKLKRYIKRAQQLLPKNQKLIVIFSVVDNSVDPFFSDNRERRIASLKANLPPFIELPLNLVIYVETARDTPPLVERLLLFNNFKALEERKEERFYFIKEWVESLEAVLADTHHIEVLDLEKVLLPRRSKIVDFDLLLSLQNKRPGSAINYFAVIYGDPSSIATSQLISITGKRLKEVNQANLHPNIDILVVYDELEHATNDVHGEQLPCGLWKTDNKSWVRATEEIKVIRFTGPFLKEWRYLGE